MRILRAWLSAGVSWVGISGFTLTCLFYLFAGEIYQYSAWDSQDVVPSVEVIICLAGGRGRISAAGEVWLRYWEQAQKEAPTPLREQAQTQVPMLYFAGIAPQATWAHLSKQLSPAVLSHIRPSDVVLENESSNTDTNARFFIRQAGKWHWKSALLLTSSYHIKRAAWIFRTLLNQARNPIELKLYPVYQEPFANRQWREETNGIRVTFLEYFKWLYYRWIWTPLYMTLGLSE